MWHLDLLAAWGASCRMRLWCPDLPRIVLLYRSDADNDSETGHQHRALREGLSLQKTPLMGDMWEAVATGGISRLQGYSHRRQSVV